MDKILELIKNQKFDMNELSKVLNVTKETLGKMLDGKVSIKASQLQKIKEFLKLDIDLSAVAGLADGIDAKDISKLTQGFDAKDLLNGVTNLFDKK